METKNELSREEVLQKAIKDGVNIEADRFFGISTDGMIFENPSLAKSHAFEKKGKIYTYLKEELSGNFQSETFQENENVDSEELEGKKVSTKSKAKS